MHPFTRLVSASVVLVGAAWLAGCTATLKKEHAETFIKGELAKKNNLKITGASCPGDKEFKVGESMECSADLDGGGKASVKATFKEGKQVEYQFLGVAFDAAGVTDAVNKKFAPVKAEGKCSKTFTFLRKGGEAVTCDFKVGEKDIKLTYSTEDDAKMKMVAAVTEKAGEAPHEAKPEELPPPPAEAPPPPPAAEAAE